MRLSGCRALVTGATGGIGHALTAELLERGADVLLAGRSAARLDEAAKSLSAHRDHMTAVVVDLTNAEDRARLVSVARYWRGGVNVLVNNAGTAQFGEFDEQSAEQIDRVIAVNLLAPMQLTRELLPQLLTQPEAAIVNVGSVFGSIGYPCNAAYSASKFGLRGFSEALRRELADRRVRVHYYAPRATRTTLNSPAVDRMNADLGVSTDTPQDVATQVCDLLAGGCEEAVLGWPERLFARVNAVVPSWVDRSIRRQLPVIRRHASNARSTQHVEVVSTAYSPES